MAGSSGAQTGRKGSHFTFPASRLRGVSGGLSALLAAVLVVGTLPLPADTDTGEDPVRIAERVPVGAVPKKEGPDRLDGRLMGVAAAARDGGPEEAEFVAKRGGLVLEGKLLQVVVEVTDGAQDAVAERVRQWGGRPQSSYGSLLQALVPSEALNALAQSPGVLRVRAPVYPVSLGQRARETANQPSPRATRPPLGGSGHAQIVSEGTAGMGLELWHGAGLRGGGTRVAVADLGFDSYARLLGTELPAQVIARSFRQDGDITGGGDPHGTAAAEVVFDVAPEATLFLVNFSTEVELGGAVDWLITQRVHIINSSVGWPGTAFGDGRGTVNDIVRKAESAGILWVQGAGNFGQTHWSGLFSDQDGNGFHNFATGDEGNTVSLRRLRPSAEQIFRVEVFLTWDDWDTFTQDYDLFLFRGDSVVSQSTAFQNGKFPPVEHIVYTTAGAGDYWIAVQRFRATRRSRLDLVVTIDYSLEHQVHEESLVVPADSPHALSVGVVEPGTVNARQYGSQGPTKDGRTKPDLVAADQVTTATYGQAGFPGTSASAPHVSGAAALIKGVRPDLDPALIRRLLTERAIEPGPGGKNSRVGAGHVFLGELLGKTFFPVVTLGASPVAP